MWFLIRAAFWLGLVFAHMDWPADTLALPDARAIASAATEKATAVCAANAAACLKIAGEANAAMTASAASPQPHPAHAKTRGPG
jgi:hypothetical protein